MKENGQFPLQPYYETQHGKAYLGDTIDIIQHIPDKSVNLVLTSPPFALTSQKEYGNKIESEYNDWFLRYTSEFQRILTDDGSFVVDLGGAYLPGHPTRSIYQYELLCSMVREQGYFLAQEFFHYNPARLPAPAEWVNVRRIRVKDSVNLVWWLSKSEYPKADNRKVLRPYTEAMKQLLRKGYVAKERPSGHNITNKFSKDNAGAIPPNVLEFSEDSIELPDNILELGNNESNSVYMLKCKEHGIKPHPARFPRRFAEFFIKFLTNEGDCVFEPFAGSNTTGYAAELLGRNWIACELDENYLKNSMLRFEAELNLFITKELTLNATHL
jgi:DNA modification methylase